MVILAVLPDKITRQTRFSRYPTFLCYNDASLGWFGFLLVK